MTRRAVVDSWMWWTKVGSVIGVAFVVLTAGVMISAHPVPNASSSEVEWHLILAPSCHSSAVVYSFPSGANVTAQWIVSTPPLSPGGVWLNMTAPVTTQWYSGYTSVDSSSTPSAELFGFVSVGGQYSFSACATDGAPGLPVYLSGQYAVPPSSS